MKCTKCGKELGGNAKFCPSCGEPIVLNDNCTTNKSAFPKELILIIVSAMVVILVMLNIKGPSNNSETRQIGKMLDKYASYATDKDSKEICGLIFVDQMKKDCSSIYYANMNLAITGRNIQCKTKFSELFDTVEYKFKDISYEPLSDDGIEKVQNMYASLGYNIPISKGYQVMATFGAENNYELPIQFQAVKINNEWKLSPQLWYVTFGEQLDKPV
ncbi:MAG: zinc-ribbon domain-containing protein [Oscillospiraceae bacterium]|nr:zinc-ribbon domain-containing protein [Oscillospiraceae bacterium]MBR3534678.1 zinc-ribbon domain-containing protein [Oscillospiraceae bacterium]MBR6836900.1 zinc-ribbon domain-containing protein [Oscillospiraceae bacterium]